MGQIFGIVSTASRRDLEAELVKTEAGLNFWQADAHGRYADNHAAIGSRLLFNTPEATLEQLPMRCPQNRYVLSCVARLDNRKELASLLGYSPAMADRLPDGRFILDAFLRWKEDCLQYFIGDFAIAIWDSAEKTLFLARDHIGVKPLLYTWANDLFLFASDISAFKAHFNPAENINKLYLARALAKVANPIPDTCYRNVVRLLPAHYYILKEGKLIGKRYWSLEADTSHGLKTEEEYYPRFRELLHEAVRCRLRIARNIGCELSGGLDSSAITILAARLLGSQASRLHTLSYVMPEAAKPFDDSWVDEEPEQEAVIAAANIPRENVHKLTGAFFDNPLDEIDYSTEVNGGISDSDCYWTEALRRKARESHVGVILSGFPGDELVSAKCSSWYFDLIARREYKTLLSLIREKPAERIKGLASYFIRRYIRNPVSGSHFTGQDNEKTRLLAPGFKKADLHSGLIKAGGFEHARFLKARINRPHTCLRMESEGNYALRNHMETRYPLADIRLLQFVLSIPPIFNKDAPRSRHTFRKATEGILPEMVRLRENKKGAPLVFHQLKFYNDQKVWIKYYKEPELFKEIFNASEFPYIIQDNIKNKQTDHDTDVRIGFWVSRFAGYIQALYPGYRRS